MAKSIIPPIIPATVTFKICVIMALKFYFSTSTRRTIMQTDEEKNYFKDFEKKIKKSPAASVGLVIVDCISVFYCIRKASTIWR